MHFTVTAVFKNTKHCGIQCEATVEEEIPAKSDPACVKRQTAQGIARAVDAEDALMSAVGRALLKLGGIPEVYLTDLPMAFDLSADPLSPVSR